MPVSAVSIASGTYAAIGVSAAGTAPTQGSGTGFTGPWRVETQELAIEYVRVPNLGSPVLAGQGLSGTTTATRTVIGSKLHAKVTARVKVQKTYDTYTTSGFQQSQKFVVAANAQDAYGESYGDLSAGGDLCLGPAGNILTDVPYYSRRAWVDNTDSEIDQTFVGYNVAFKERHYIFGYNQFSAVPVDQHFGDFRVANNPLLAGPHQSNYEATTFFAGVPFYQITGAYQTNKESDANTRSYVDGIAAMIPSVFKFFTEEPVLTANSPAGLPKKEAVPATLYKVDRHDWS